MLLLLSRARTHGRKARRNPRNGKGWDIKSILRDAVKSAKPPLWSLGENLRGGRWWKMRPRCGGPDAMCGAIKRDSVDAMPPFPVQKSRPRIFINIFGADSASLTALMLLLLVPLKKYSTALILSCVISVFAHQA